MTIHARLAHMGIYVKDRDVMRRFYTEVLGLVVTDQGEGRGGAYLTFLSGNQNNHHQLVLVSGRPDTSGFNPIQQMSFMIDSLARPARGASAGSVAGCHRHAAGQPWQCLVDVFQGPGGQHGGSLSRHAVPRVAAAWGVPRSVEVGRRDPARHRSRLPQGPELHAVQGFHPQPGRAAGALGSARVTRPVRQGRPQLLVESDCAPGRAPQDVSLFAMRMLLAMVAGHRAKHSFGCSRASAITQCRCRMIHHFLHHGGNAENHGGPRESERPPQSGRLRLPWPSVVLRVSSVVKKCCCLDRGRLGETPTLRTGAFPTFSRSHVCPDRSSGQAFRCCPLLFRTDDIPVRPFRSAALLV